MEIKELRAAIMGLAKAGQNQADIAATMKVSRKTVWRLIKRFNETNTTNARPRSGRPRTVNTPALRASESAHPLQQPVFHEQDGQGTERKSKNCPSHRPE